MDAMTTGDRVTVWPVEDLPPEVTEADTRDAADCSLIGSCCEDCGDLCFPARAVCIRCGSPRVRELPMPTRGRLYSFSTVHVSSARPTPYTIGYVDLDNGVRLLAQLTVSEGLSCDMRVHLSGWKLGAFQFAPDASRDEVG